MPIPINLPQSRILLGYKDLFGGVASDEEIRQRVSRYPLEQVLEKVSQLNCTFFCRDREHTHRAVLQLLCGDEGVDDRVVAFKSRLQTDHPSSPPAIAIFNEVATLHVGRVALQACSRAIESSSQTGADFHDLCVALLMANNLIYNDAPMEREAQQRWLFANSLAHYQSRDDHSLARCHLLYLMDRPELRSHPQYVDLPAAFRRATGLSTEEYWAFCFALIAHFRVQMHGPAPPEFKPVHLAAYFRREYNFSDASIAAFSKLIVSELVDLVADAVGAPQAVFGFDVTYAKLRPFAAINDVAIPLSLAHGFQKLTRGLHHVFLMTSVFSKGERQRFLNYLGRVFEEYVFDGLVRMAGARNVHRIDDFDGAEESRADFAVVTGADLVLVETKSTSFTVDVRHAASAKAFDAKLNEVVYEPCRQIQATATRLLNGKFNLPGVDISDVRKIYGVGILMEQFPFLPIQGVDKVAASEDTGPVDSIAIMDVDDFEVLEAALAESEISLGLALMCRTSSAATRLRPIRDFISGLGARGDLTNSFLRTRFEAVSDSAVGVFERNKKQPPDT